MNKTKIISTISAIAVATLLGLTACGGHSTSSTSIPLTTQEGVTVAQNDYVGEYSLFAIGQEDKLYGAEEYGSFLSGFVSSATDTLGVDDEDESVAGRADISEGKLVVKESGTADLVVFSEVLECTWVEDNDELVLEIPDSESSETTTMTGSLEGGILSIKDTKSGSVMVFVSEGADTSEIETVSLSDSLREFPN